MAQKTKHNGWDVVEMARDRPVAAAAVAASAAATGLFLWSRRAQIRDKLDNLSDQISEWSRSTDDDTGGLTTAASARSRSTTSRRGRARRQSTT
jgi:hypothetical protein